ncbi:MAG TPA: VanZ family protein [Dongiaceae bacterium]|nr:VanZ family protein [Dongiaceae bacterium]
MSLRLKYWLPAIVIAVLISAFSTRYFSAEETARVIFPILHWLFPFANRHALHFAHFLIRKAAHITEFAAFSIAVFHGVRGPRSGWKLSWAIWTLAIAIAYAGLDEWHQSFVPMREPRLRDVFIDGIGALLAQTAVWVYAKIHRSPAASAELREKTVQTIPE